jgi:uncharacterized protein YmfQ (DUF2313 family)
MSEPLFTAEDYRDALELELPRGPAWPRRGLVSVLRSLLHAWGDELARVDGRAQALHDEADPRTTTELLPDHERVAALPGVCLELGSSVALRRQALVAKLTDKGGYHPDDYIAAAAAAGFTVTLTEFTPTTCGDLCGDPLYGSDWWYALQINADLVTIQAAVVGGASCGDPLRFWGNDLLECVMAEFRQAQVVLLFAYT